MVNLLIRSRYCKVLVFIHVSDSKSFLLHHCINAVSKQMKTINFSLSSQKYSTQGWAVRVSSGKHPHQVMQQVNHRRRRRRDRASVQATDNFLQPTICLRNDITNAKVFCKNVPWSTGNINVSRNIYIIYGTHCITGLIYSYSLSIRHTIYSVVVIVTCHKQQKFGMVKVWRFGKFAFLPNLAYPKPNLV